MARELDETITGFLSAWDGGDVARLRHLLSPDTRVEIENPFAKDTSIIRGQAAVARMLDYLVPIPATVRVQTRGEFIASLSVQVDQDRWRRLTKVLDSFERSENPQQRVQTGLVTWIKTHWLLALIVVTTVIVIPVLLGAVVGYTDSRGWPRLLVESVLGGWPDPADDPRHIVSEQALVVGVIIWASLVLGIPTLLGLFVAILLDRVERRFPMRLEEYLRRRDSFLFTELTKTLTTNVSVLRQLGEDANANDQIIDEIARSAIRNAQQAWERNLSRTLQRDLAETEISAVVAR